MIRSLITRWASRTLASQRKDPKEAYRAKARQMCERMGKEIPAVLRP